MIEGVVAGAESLPPRTLPTNGHGAQIGGGHVRGVLPQQAAPGAVPESAVPRDAAARRRLENDRPQQQPLGERSSRRGRPMNYGTHSVGAKA
jgi:hypothetical protein